MWLHKAQRFKESRECGEERTSEPCGLHFTYHAPGVEQVLFWRREPKCDHASVYLRL